MKQPAFRTGLAIATLAVAAATAGPALAGPPFGNPDDVAFANKLWQDIAASHFVGPDALVTYPYASNPPHGDVLTFIQGKATVDGRTATVLVKHNYYGDGLDPDEVLAHPAKYLQSITVMFRREAGYDPADKDWFWAKYAADGSLMTNPKGLKLAGRVAKGASVGCIACHANADGDDFVYTNIPVSQ